MGLEVGLRLTPVLFPRLSHVQSIIPILQILRGRRFPQTSCSDLSQIGPFLSKLLITFIKWSIRHEKINISFSDLKDWNSLLSGLSALHSTARIILQQRSSVSPLPYQILKTHHNASQPSPSTRPNAPKYSLFLTIVKGPKFSQRPSLMLVPSGIHSVCPQWIPALILEPSLISYDYHFALFQHL